MSLGNKRLIKYIISILLLCPNNVWSCSKYVEMIQTADLSEAGERARRELGHELMREYDFPSKVLKRLMNNEMEFEKSNILQKYGDVLLDMAVYRSNYVGVRYLLSNGIPLFSKRQFIESPIFVAASAKDKKMLELLKEMTSSEYTQLLRMANKYIDCVNSMGRK